MKLLSPNSLLSTGLKKNRYLFGVYTVKKYVVFSLDTHKIPVSKATVFELDKSTQPQHSEAKL